MTPFRDLPIKTKLQRVITLTTVVALGVACSFIMVYQWYSYRRASAQLLTSISANIADNCQAALSFRDRPAARETLATVQAVPEIVGVWLYLPDGRPFAEFTRPGQHPIPVAPGPMAGKLWYEGNQLLLLRPIRVRGEAVGLLGLRADMHVEIQSLRYSIAMVLGCMLLAAAAALVWAGRLQRVILDPILDLAQVAGAVARERDYALRAKKQSHDEVGRLTETFNDMLAHIETRDTQLQETNEQLDLAAQRLRVSEERFRQLTENISEVFWLTDVQHTQMLYISPGYERIWGRTCDSLVRDPGSWQEAIHGEDRERVARAAARMSDETYDVEYRVVQPNGTIRWVHDRGFPIRDATDAVYRIAGIAEDVTARKEAAAALQEMRARLQNIYDSSQDAIVSATLDGRLVEFNRAYEQLTGYTAAELRAIDCRELTTPEFREMEERILERVGRTGLAEQYEKEYRRKDGRRVVVALNVFLVKDDARNGVALASVIRDVTEQRRLQQQILEVSDREQRRIGHDIHDGLCQLLTGISFGVQAFEERLFAAGRPEARDAHSLVALVQQASEDARNVARGLHPVGLEEGGLISALSDLALTINNLYNVSCRLECDPEFSMNDTYRRLHVYRIVQEAITNAIKHGRATQVVIHLVDGQETVSLDVVDNGSGLPERLDPRQGMGLNIMAYRARMLGGTLHVERIGSGGTIVNVVFPIRPGREGES